MVSAIHNPRKSKDRGLPVFAPGTPVVVNDSTRLNVRGVVVEWNHGEPDAWGRYDTALLRLDPVKRLDGTVVFQSRERAAPHWAIKRVSEQNPRGRADEWKYGAVALLPAKSFGGKYTKADMLRWAKVMQSPELLSNSRDNQISILNRFDRYVSLPISVYRLGDIEELGVKAKPLYEVTRADKDYWDRKFDEDDRVENPGFLPKSLFDRYEIRDGSTSLQSNIQTLSGARSAVKKWAKKHPCSSLAIWSSKFNKNVETFKPANGRGLQVDSDNSREYKREAEKAAKADTKYSLMIDGEHFADYDSEGEAKAAGKVEGKGKQWRVKAVARNPRITRTKIVDMGGGYGLMTERSVFSGDLLYYPVKRGTSHPDGKPFWHKVRTSAYEYNFRNRASVMRHIKVLQSGKVKNPGGRHRRYVVQGARRKENPSTKYVFKIAGLPSDKQYNALPFGRQIEYRRAIDAFKSSAQKTWISAKRKSTASALAEFKRLYKPTQWFFVNHDGPDYHDDSFEIWYKTAEQNPRRNPFGSDRSDASALYEQFHGQESDGEFDYVDRMEVPDTFTGLGDLVELWVLPVNGKGRKSIKIAAPDPDRNDLHTVVKLASNAAGTQLYFIGGDQALDVEALGFSNDEIKNHMVIGILTELTYRSQKKFHRFVPTDYFHKTGEETGHEPTLMYDPVNRQMNIAGGAYRVKDVGIVN